jgi:hypothetical protein
LSPVDPNDAIKLALLEVDYARIKLAFIEGTDVRSEPWLRDLSPMGR